jgi:hypothetical protein
MKKWLTKVGTALIIAGLSTVLTNLITGQPLTGLTKLKGLSQIFLRSSVPAWAFALALFGALLGLYSFVGRLLRGQKGRVQFVPDAHNSGWAQTETQMEVRAGGTFTYEGTGSLTVLKGFLKGTQPITDMMVLQETSGGLGGPVSVGQLDLEAHVPVRALINMRVTPVRGTRGKPLRSRLIFRDKYNRDYKFDVNLPYIGQR